MHAFNNDLTPSNEDRALLPVWLRRLPRESFTLAQKSFKFVTTPAVPTIREAMAQASWLAAGALLIVLLLSATLVNSLFYLASAFFFHMRAFEWVWYNQAQPGVNLLLIPPVCVLVGIVVLYGLARLFGGQGTFLTTLYPNLLFQVPLVLLTSIFTTILLEGGTWLIPARTLVLIAIQLYCAVFQVLILRTVHRLSLGRAVIGVVVLVILLSPLALFLSITLF